jgi:hypothetical protein
MSIVSDLSLTDQLKIEEYRRNLIEQNNMFRFRIYYSDEYNTIYGDWIKNSFLEISEHELNRLMNIIVEYVWKLDMNLFDNNKCKFSILKRNGTNNEIVDEFNISFSNYKFSLLKKM